ncbi:hypothetical protein FCN77_21645 [Arthrobacter sp. 24S4-2]|uniref:hypothetical protein n=1 Tax=Arthrobacter sp. 24S4-2 TaxID=2575374 RepID=UPI0010C79CD1|nr:hypothetical protein [Arthrobacter sp. 24S4-2]QCO99839.1 hypothetical protein FCN77_21645 [Arthrobacter sp. 24S4-2]
MDSLGDDDRRPARTTRTAGIAMPLAALALLTAGALLAIAGALLAVTGRGQESFGWVAHAPLSSQALVSGGLFFLSAQTKAGFMLAGAGLLVLTFRTGYILGRRRS